MVEGAENSDGDVIPPLAEEWLQLRMSVPAVAPPVVLIGGGLPLRARRVLDEHSVTTVQQLLALDPQRLVENANVGWTSVAALLAKATESLAALSINSEAPDFVQLVDVVLRALPIRAREVVVGRFEEHARSAELARRIEVSRERVRQIEEKFVQRVRRESVRHRSLSEDLLDDQLVDFSELTKGRQQPDHAPGLYVAVARAVICDGDSYVDVERFYKTRVDVLVKAIRNRDDFLSASFLVADIKETVSELAPALGELGDVDIRKRVIAALRSREVAGRLIGPKPQVGRLIRALLRSVGGTSSLDYLVSRLASVLAAYGEVSYFDIVRLRGKLVMMPDVHLVNEQTATLNLPDDSLLKAWLDRAVEAICEADRPYSIVRFLDENEDAPFDEYGLASLLRSDSRVAQLGRRLYSSAAWEVESPIRVAALIQAALVEAGAPMTRRELREYVRFRRDLVCGQMENYFHRVPGLISYTTDLVGLWPMTRDVMLRLLRREPCVVSLLGALETQDPMHYSKLWLGPGDEPDLTLAEQAQLLAAAKGWRTAFAELQASGVFFGIREG